MSRQLIGENQHTPNAGYPIVRLNDNIAQG